jgi:alpha-tubulin suppressor-like RCC1 family protein
MFAAGHHFSAGVGRKRLLALSAALVVAAIIIMTPAAASASSFGATAWGSGVGGQLGDGTGESKDVPSAVSGLSGVVALSTGSPIGCGFACGGHTLALLSNGTVMAWGNNNFGQLGNGTTLSTNVPVAVSGLSNVVAVAAGGEFSLALLKNGTVESWGYNNRGQLGNGTEAASDVPVSVTNLKNVTSIAAGLGHSLAVLSNGTVEAWGWDSFGQLGTPAPEECGFTACSKFPLAISGLSEVAAVSAGGTSSTAVLKAGTVSVWGNGTSAVSSVSGLSEVTATATGAGHRLALLSNHTVMSWGGNAFGQLGDGTTETSEAPVKVDGLSGVKAIAAGEEHSLALLENGTVMSWGENDSGQLGDGTFTGPETCISGFEHACARTPVAVSGLGGVAGITAGFDCSLAFGEPFPGVTGVNPVSGPTAGGTSVTITGINLTGATAVKFGTVAATSFVVNSGMSITAVAPAGTGTVDVTVTTPAGTSAPGIADHFTYGPTVSALNPSSGVAAGGTTVAITGTNLTEASAVHFGADSATSFTINSATSITAVSPAGAGTVDVTVTTPEGTSPSVPADEFTYIPLPAVTGLTPTTGVETGGTAVTIFGSNFTGATSVKFGQSNAASFTVRSASEIAAVSPPGTETVDVTVTTPGGTSSTVPPDQFTYVLLPPPTVTKLKPASGSVIGGTSVTIIGTNLSTATAVRFGSMSATTFKVASATTITAVSPAEAAGIVDVTVTTPSGTTPLSKSDRFHFAPAVTGLSPTAGSKAGGASVTITGAGFALGTTATTVKFGTAKATSVNCTSATSCTVVAPAHAVGAVDVRATVNKVISPKSRPADEFTYE